jgi:hypothetical protein
MEMVDEFMRRSNIATKFVIRVRRNLAMLVEFLLLG